MTNTFPVHAKKSVHEDRIPFEIEEEIPNEETRAAVEEVAKMKNNPSIGKTYEDVDSMMEDLLKEN